MRHPSKHRVSQHVNKEPCDASKGTSNQTKRKNLAFEWQFVEALHGVTYFENEIIVM